MQCKCLWHLYPPWLLNSYFFSFILFGNTPQSNALLRIKAYHRSRMFRKDYILIMELENSSKKLYRENVINTIAFGVTSV